MTPAQELFSRIFETERVSDEQLARCKLACALAIEAQSLPEVSVVRSVDVAEILAKINIDVETLIATLVSDANLESIYNEALLAERFGQATADLVLGIRKLNDFKEFDIVKRSDEVQNERLRQMLLAMTSDIRIMIVKLAYRVARLRHLKFEDEQVRHQIASETQLIFAPLANRLGIAQLKWELEDLSFRFLHPIAYKEIASQLKMKRHEREIYIEKVMDTLNNELKKHDINADISGRPKHIYSIWKKMQRKALSIEELNDLRAIRIYVDSVKDCYEVLGAIHSHWRYVEKEFDDYIATPKDNGYQSIHTVIIGPEAKTLEIQIRTPEMHYNSEYGVAAHWRYKEGGKGFDKKLERSISNVRQMLQNTDDPGIFKEISTELQSQHIFVMTPSSDIITLNKGATPLDFAYNIHTELGHRCRGAKINGRIKTLSTALNTGDKVEILTIKNGHPSRNWLNPNLGYLTSSSARTKVRSWFSKQNRAENISAGEAVFNREIKRLHASSIKTAEVVKRFKYEDSELFFEDIGKGRLNERQIANALQRFLKPKQQLHGGQKSVGFSANSDLNPENNNIAYVVGAVHLKSTLAPCCEPKFGDDIVGYVTRGRGITIHKSDCLNVLNMSYEELQRLIEVSWHKESAEFPSYQADLHIVAFDRKGLLRDVMSTLTGLDINVVSSQTRTDSQEYSVEMDLTVELDSKIHLGDLLDQLQMIQNIESVSIQTE
jgi:GTP pyrophosphokinase